MGNNDYLEFIYENNSNSNEEMNGQSDEHLLFITSNTRDSFRIPLDEDNSALIKILIDELEYKIINVSYNGVQVSFYNSNAFYKDQNLNNMKLIFDDKELLLQGKVIYISKKDPKTYICGIKLYYLDKKDKNEVIKFIHNKRNEIFNK